MDFFRHRNLISVALIGAAALTLTGLARPVHAADDSGSKTTLSISAKAPVNTMDSSLNTDAYGAQSLNNTMEGLYRFTGQKLKPAIAKQIAAPTNDGKRYTIDLKKTKWSNGDPVTAHDFVYAWQRMVDPKTASQYAYIYSGIKNADAIAAGKKKPSELGIKALGPYKLQIDLDHPIPFFDTLMSSSQFYPLNQKVVEKLGDQYGLSSKGMVFNGPYKLKNWKVGDTEWTDVKNDSYWNAKHVQLHKIKYYYIADPNTGLNLYDTNVLDRYQDLSGDTARQLANSKQFKTDPSNSTSYLELNQKKIPALKNAKLRQAMALTINRNDLSNIILGKTGLPAHSLVPSKMSKNPETGQDFTNDPQAVADRKYTAYNPTKAKKLWQEGMKETGQKELKLTFTADNLDTTKKMAEYIQNNMENDLPGLKLTISTVPFKTRLQRQTSGEFDMVTSAWNADYPDPTNFLDLMTTGNSQNNGKWSNKAFDQQEKAATTTNANDPMARWQNMQTAQHILTQQQGIIPLYQYSTASVTKPGIHGFQVTPTGQYDMGAIYKK
ncbi:peptide ABC transporter substrate-binding protein [Fructilactobacillus myrtifloralis]|uniref:Peptide ABC transporter substrate-binding protein n=1 Tax=Fructilactobacillus myrtifloralis TaxID=2940301 RepID=A0ABY5BPW7_9LACO|nr:peptide ABC transporter substrate-binding protein [Fructilactobacillus myrtifloralis]USS85754.1 peptide ABC transporter substrate-binding protein [Fructilactobacillus myrtifloralis]